MGLGGVTRRGFLVGGAASAAAAGLVGLRQESTSAARLPAVAFTWDGIWQTLFLHGLPLFKEHGFPATAYVITGKTGGSIGTSPDTFCTWDQIAAFADAGWEISSHTVDHIGLPHLTTDQIVQEVLGAKQELVDRGYPAPGFAYPYNNFDHKSIDVVQRFHEHATAGPSRKFSDIHSVHDLYTLPRHPLKHLSADLLIASTRQSCLVEGRDRLFLGHRVVTPSQYETDNQLAITTAALGRFLRWLAGRQQEGRLEVTTCRVLVRRHLLEQ